MRARLLPVLRASSSSAASVSPAPAALWTAASVTRRRGATSKSRRPRLFSCPFSQQHSLRNMQPGSAHGRTSRVPASVAGFLAWKPAEPVSDVTVHGFVRSVRSMKKYSFVTLGDGSSLAPLQAVVPADLAEGLTNGAAVRLQGSWTPSPGAGQSHELHVQAVEVLGPSDAKTFPIQKKYQTPEYLRTLPHLRSRVPFNSALLRFRSDVIASLNRFFASCDFVQTHPPLITSSDCEGAGEVFSVSPAGDNTAQITQHEASANGSAKTDGDDLFFRSPKYLTVSTQLHLEALAQSVGNVWTLSPTFRAEESDTPRHLSEFYMLEAEVCFVDQLSGVMDLLEDMLRFVAAENRDSRVFRELLERPSKGGHQGRQENLDDPQTVEQRWAGLLADGPWPRVTYTEAIRILAAAPVQFDYAPTWGVGLQTEHEKYLASVVGGGKTPVFVTHYPRDIKAFYMLPSGGGAEHSSSDGSRVSDAQASGTSTVDCFDLLVPEFCEIAGGSMREHRLPQLVGAMQARGLSTTTAADAHAHAPGEGVSQPSGAGDLGWYVDLRRWGCPPHGGFGLGFDRLLCYLSGVQTIRDMVAFPRWYGRCDC